MKSGLISALVIKPDRNDVDFEQWMHMYSEFIYSCSFLLDLKSFFKATQMVLAGGGW